MSNTIGIGGRRMSNASNYEGHGNNDAGGNDLIMWVTSRRLIIQVH